MTKKITTLCCTVAMLATTAATPALSQSKNFAGPSIAISGNLNHGQIKVTERANDEIAQVDAGLNETTSFKLGNDSTTFSIDLSQTFALDNKFALGIGAGYDFGKIKLGQTNYSESVLTTTSTLNLELKDHYNIYLQPMYIMSDNSSIFGKVGYNFAKGTLKATLDNASGSASKNFEGWNYGIGAKFLIDKNLFIQTEANYTVYDSVKADLTSSFSDTYGDEYSLTFKPEVLSAKISIGYKF